LPSDWSAIADAPPATPSVTLPPLPKSGSSAPLGKGVTQPTATSVTSASPTMPVPLLTVHTCSGLVGCESTRTSYESPLENG
jgi:hypothetical protein